MGHFLIYDEQFVRRSGDDQPQVHAFCVGEPRWADDRFRVGGPANWPERWEESFGLGRVRRSIRGDQPVRATRAVDPRWAGFRSHARLLTAF